MGVPCSWPEPVTVVMEIRYYHWPNPGYGHSPVAGGQGLIVSQPLKSQERLLKRRVVFPPCFVDCRIGFVLGHCPVSFAHIGTMISKWVQRHSHVLWKLVVLRPDVVDRSWTWVSDSGFKSQSCCSRTVWPWTICLTRILEYLLFSWATYLTWQIISPQQFQIYLF